MPQFWVVFFFKSLNMCPIFHEKIPNYKPDFTKFSRVKSGLSLRQNFKIWVPFFRKVPKWVPIQIWVPPPPGVRAMLKSVNALSTVEEIWQIYNDSVPVFVSKSFGLPACSILLDAFCHRPYCTVTLNSN